MPTEPKAGLPPVAPRKPRDIVLTTQSKKDFKREEKGRHRATLRAELQAVVDALADDIPLPSHMVDHALGGKWKDHRDCHIKPDLVLIYRKIAAVAIKAPQQWEKPKLSLIRLGSHSELGF